MDGYRFGGHRVCTNTQVRTDLVEIAVWHEVCQLLQDPQRLEREYHRRGQVRPRGAKWETPESLRAQITKLQRGMARLIDGYAEGVIEKGEFEPRIKRLKQRVTILEAQVQQLADEALQQRELKLLIGQLEEFVTKVQRNLATADWAMKREIIRALVRRVEIDKQEVTVVFRVGPDPSGSRPRLEKQSSQHCWRREGRPLRDSRLRGLEVLADQHARPQIFADQPQQRFIVNLARHAGHQGVGIHPVEEFRQVHVHGYPVPRFEVALDLLDGVVRRAFGPKAEARHREVRVEERAQHLRYRLLDHPIDDGRKA